MLASLYVCIDIVQLVCSCCTECVGLPNPQPTRELVGLEGQSLVTVTGVIWLNLASEFISGFVLISGCILLLFITIYLKSFPLQRSLEGLWKI